MAGFKSTWRKGFHMSFENGLTVSVQFGAGNYCDNYHDMDFFSDKDAQSSDAEIAIWHKDHTEPLDWISVNYFLADAYGEGHGGVCGYLSPEQVAELLYKASIEDEETFWQRYGEYYRNEYGEELEFND